ncbi:MAG TPA: NAD(P)-dependent oxidoreductase [Bryobacteraceae bacterium]|jgi:dTDP-glucose 4,6-dehydratase
MPHVLEQDLDHVLAHTSRVWDSLRGANIFITGGTGFVGTWLVESLVWANRRLNLNARAVLLTRNQKAFHADPSISFIHGEANAFAFPEGEFPFVIHAAANTGSMLSDIEATQRVLEFARICGVKRLLFTSSGAVYGKQPPSITHIPEDYAGAPCTDYGHAKRISESLCASHASQSGFAAVIARLFAFTGPYLPLDINFAAGNFIRDALRGGPIHIAGDGTPYRSYLYAADMAIWLWTLLIHGESARPYNVGSGEEVTIQQLAQAVAAATNLACQIEIARMPVPGAEPSRYVPSVERARVELGLQPLIPLKEGLRRMLAWNVMSANAANTSA